MGSNPTLSAIIQPQATRPPLKTRRLTACPPRARTRKRSAQVGHSQKDSQKERRLNIVGSEIRWGVEQLATACDKYVAKRIAEALLLTAGLSGCRCGGLPPPRGLLSSLVVQSDKLARVVFDAIDSPGKTLGHRRSKLRTLAQGYVELRGWLETAEQRANRQRKLMNQRLGEKRRHALRRRSPFGDTLEVGEPEPQEDVDE